MCLFYESAILFLGIYPKTAVTHRLKTIHAKMFRENSKNKTVKPLPSKVRKIINDGKKIQ